MLRFELDHEHHHQCISSPNTFLLLLPTLWHAIPAQPDHSYPQRSASGGRAEPITARSRQTSTDALKSPTQAPAQGLWPVPPIPSTDTASCKHPQWDHPLRTTRGFTSQQWGRAGRAGEQHGNTIKPHKCASDSQVVIRKVVPALREGRKTMARVFPGRLQLLMCKLLLTHGQQQVQLCCNLLPHTQSWWAAALAVRERRAELILPKEFTACQKERQFSDLEMLRCRRAAALSVP